jgi:hypothetical protein
MVSRTVICNSLIFPVYSRFVKVPFGRARLVVIKHLAIYSALVPMRLHHSTYNHCAIVLFQAADAVPLLVHGANQAKRIHHDL